MGRRHVVAVGEAPNTLLNQTKGYYSLSYMPTSWGLVLPPTCGQPKVTVQVVNY